MELAPWWFQEADVMQLMQPWPSPEGGACLLLM